MKLKIESTDLNGVALAYMLKGLEKWYGTVNISNVTTRVNKDNDTVVVLTIEHERI